MVISDKLYCFCLYCLFVCKLVCLFLFSWFFNTCLMALVMVISTNLNDYFYYDNTFTTLIPVWWHWWHWWCWWLGFLTKPRVQSAHFAIFSPGVLLFYNNNIINHQFIHYLYIIFSAKLRDQSAHFAFFFTYVLFLPKFILAKTKAPAPAPMPSAFHQPDF